MTTPLPSSAGVVHPLATVGVREGLIDAIYIATRSLNASKDGPELSKDAWLAAIRDALPPSPGPGGRPPPNPPTPP